MNRTLCSLPVLRVLVSLTLVLGLAGCGEGRSPQDAAAVSAPVLDVDAYIAETTQWRQRRQDSLLKPDGWTTLVGLHWLDATGSFYVGTASGNEIRFAFGPAVLGKLQVEEDRVYLIPAAGSQLTLEDEVLEDRVELRAGGDGQPATTIGFDDGKGQFTLIQRGERRALRPRHADAPTRLNFAGLEHWPVDPQWRIEARYIAHEEGRKMPIADIVGAVIDTPNPGAVEFQRDGRTYRIEALGDPRYGLSFMFADRTNGKQTYPAGRFLSAAHADENNIVILDFNRAYTPPCAFTDYATCQLPPAQNHLDLEVLAGEQNYKRPDVVGRAGG